MIKEGHTDRNECQNAERLSSIRQTSDKQCRTSVESADRFYLENILKNLFNFSQEVCKDLDFSELFAKRSLNKTWKSNAIAVNRF